jgi:hypothetical protein
VTALGATVNLRHPNWRGTVQYDFVNVHREQAQSDLVIRMAVAAGESWSCDVFDWLANAYDLALLSFTSTSQAEQTYDFNENEHVSNTGGVRFRCVDANQVADETRGTISVDSAYVRTRYPELLNPGGGDLDQLLFLRCTPGLFSTACYFELAPEVTGVLIERTDWYADGDYFAQGKPAQGDSGRRHTAILEGFRVREAVNVTVLSYFTNGQAFEVSEIVTIDNTWVIVIAFAVGLLTVVLLAAWILARRAGHADRRKKKEDAAGQRETWRDSLWGGP